VEIKNNENIRIFNGKIADFIPVVCHYNDTTLLTKNADLVQTIEIQGFIDKDSIDQEKVLRTEVRSAIANYANDPDMAIHLHVVRDYKNIMPKPYQGSDTIVNLVENEWCKQNNWDRQLVNTLYITLVKKGPRLKLFNIADFFTSIISYTLKYKYKSHLEKSINALNDVTKNISDQLKVFSSKILTIIKEDNDFYSEPLSFYYYLTHFKHKKIKVEQYDFSELLADFNISTDFNVLRNKSDNKTKYVAIYSLELKSSVSTEFLEPITQCHSQFIISELITLVSNKKALRDIESYKKALKSVKNLEMSGDLYIDEVINSDKGKVNDFCSSQINIIFHYDNSNLLQENIEAVSEQFNILGIKVVREDFDLQSIFYLNLPGNTFYGNRSFYLPTSFVATFSNIHSKSMGNYNGSIWGEPVTILRTLKGGYYNFNYHYKNNGNTIIVGPKGTGKTTLTHFLLAQSLKFDIKIIYIDLEGRSDKFLKSINGNKIKLEKDKESPIQIDLLNIDNYDGNVNWFADLLLKICAYDDTYRSNNKNYIEKFNILAKELINTENYDEKIKLLDNFIESSNDITLKTNYKKFFQSDFFAKFFKHDKTTIFNNEKYLGIDFAEIADYPELFNPFLSLLLAILPKFLTGEKTIIVVNHSHSIFEASAFQNQILNWLQKLTNTNAMILLTQENIADKSIHQNLADIMPYFASQLYLSNRMLDKDFRHIFSLSNQEFNYIKSYDQSKRRFLVKHGDDSVFAKMDLSDLKKVLDYLG
jgi:type IV secretion system protein VirB4